MSTNTIFPYPPDNAALLYYQAFLMIERIDVIMLKTLADLLAGRIKPNEEIKKYIKSCQNIIDLIVLAAEVPNCNWGLDYSKGALTPPHLGYCRYVARLILADAQLSASTGNYKQALSRCLTTRKMGHHIRKGDLLCYLLGTTIISLADKSIRDILGNVSRDVTTLLWFKNELIQSESRVFSLKSGVEIELQKLSIYMSKDTAEKAFEPDFYEWAKVKLPKHVADYAIRAPEEFFRQNEKYWNSYKDRVIAALDLPYKEAYSSLSQLQTEIKQKADEPNAALTSFWASNFPLVYCHSIRMSNSYNAIKVAIELYIIKAKTSRLPDKLPANLPKDLFSGNDFEYTKTDNGFILRCLAKDLRKEEVLQYEFKV